MTEQSTYEELVQRVKELEKEVAKVKRSKKELSQERDIFLKGPVVVFKWSAKRNWAAEYVSPNVAQFGYQADDFTSNKLLYIDIIHPEDKERVVSEVQAHIESGIGSYEQEYRIIQTDGKVKWIYEQTVVHRDDKNKIINYDGYILDNTERKRAEETLKENAEQLQKLTQASFDGVVIIEKGVIQETNQTFADLYGYEPSEIIGMNALDFIAPESKDVVLNKIMTSYVKPYEATVQKKDGTKFEVEACGAAITYKGRPARITAMRDISERKQAQEALLESELNFRALAENVNDGILIAIDDGSHVFANKRASEITGYTTSELFSTNIKDLAHPDEFDRIIERYKRIISGKSFPIQYETMIINKDGKALPIEASSAKTVWQGKPADIVSIRDITERKQMERALQEAHDELEHRVQERTEELELKTKSLENVNTAMKVLLQKRQKDKTDIEDNVLTNVKELISPYFDKIKATKLDQQQKTFLSIIESNINEIISPFARKLSLKYLKLTPTEIKIANMIKYGNTTKKIAQIMSISPRTVDTHRKNIRKKVGLEKGSENLRSYLLSFQ